MSKTSLPGQQMQSVNSKRAMIGRRRFMGLVGGSAALLAAPRIASAQAYPDKPVRAIVTFAPGGTADVYARLACAYLSEKLGQRFVVENIAGATGNRGTVQAARSTADGYTILFALSTHAVNASVFTNIPYDPIADFVAINLSVSSTHVVSVNPSVPVKDAKELVAYLKARSNQNYAHGGVGTQAHLLAERFRVTQKLDIVGVPFPGAGPAVQAVVGNHVPIGWTTMASAGPMISGRQLNALAVTGKTRSKLLPDVPTMIEQGFPEIQGDTWVGVMAPKGTPDSVVTTINTAISEFLQQPAAQQRLAEVGFEVVNKGPAEFSRILVEETGFWKKIVEETGVKVE